MVDNLILLFSSDSTEFSSNGIGSLNEASSCKVTEERNGLFELEMNYPVAGRLYNQILKRNIILVKPNPHTRAQPFRIYALVKRMDFTVDIFAEHVSYDLSGFPVSPFSAGNVATAFLELKANSIFPCPFNFSTDKNTDALLNIITPVSMRSALGGMDGSIIDVYRGEYEFDRFNVNLWNNRGAERGVSIRYGKNLTDFSEEDNDSSVYTGVYPYYYSDEYGLVQLPEKIVNAEGSYSFTKILPLDLSEKFTEFPTEEALRSAAISYIQNEKIGVPNVSLKVSFIELSKTEDYKNYAILETVKLCDTVNVYFPEMNVSATAKCVKTVYNPINDRYDSVDLGSIRSGLSSTIVEQDKKIDVKPSKSKMEQAIEYSTKLMSGGLGGYVLIHSSTGDKHPDEILIMDTNDIMTATSVWRWNSAGMAYSPNGYGGEYSIAITMDGAIVGNSITMGVINGSLIAADSISSESISQSFKNEVTNQIGEKTFEVEQSFVASNAMLQSIISSMDTKFEEDITLLETQGSILQQTIDNLSLTFFNRSVGGINLIRNSSAQNGVADDWIYTGTVLADSGSDTTNNITAKSAFRILTGTMAQEINVIPGKQYTIGITAKTNDGYAGAVLDIGGSETIVFDDYNDSSWLRFSVTITAAANTMSLLLTSVGESYFGDIMLNEGGSITNWSPAPDELYTTNIKFDRRGLRVTNKDSDTETVIDNTQFAVLHKNETVITVNKDETLLKRATVNGVMTVGKLRIIPKIDGVDFVLLD